LSCPLGGGNYSRQMSSYSIRALASLAVAAVLLAFLDQAFNNVNYRSKKAPVFKIGQNDIGGALGVSTNL